MQRVGSGLGLSHGVGEARAPAARPERSGGGSVSQHEKMRLSEFRDWGLGTGDWRLGSRRSPLIRCGLSGGQAYHEETGRERPVVS